MRMQGQRFALPVKPEHLTRLTPTEGLRLLRDAISAQSGLTWGVYGTNSSGTEEYCALGALSVEPKFVARCGDTLGVWCEAFEQVAAENDKYMDDEKPEDRRNRMLCWVERRIAEEEEKERALLGAAVPEQAIVRV